MSDRKSFEYTYTSPQRQDGQKHMGGPAPTDPEAGLKPVILAVAQGALSCLCFGAGLALVLKTDLLFWGILLGLLGIAGMSVCPFVYTQLCRQAKERKAEISENRSS